MVSTVVVLVQPTVQVDAIVNPRRDLYENAPCNKPCRPLNLSEKSFVINTNPPHAGRLFDPYIELLFLVALEKLLYRFSEKNSLGHLKLFSHPV